MSYSYVDHASKTEGRVSRKYLANRLGEAVVAKLETLAAAGAPHPFDAFGHTWTVRA